MRISFRWTTVVLAGTVVAFLYWEAAAARSRSGLEDPGLGHLLVGTELTVGWNLLPERSNDVAIVLTHLQTSCDCAEAGLDGGIQTKDPAGRSNWTVLPGENGRLWAKFTVEPGVQAVDIRYHLAVGSARPELHTRTLRYTGTEGLSFYRQGERVRELLITDLEGGERRKVDLELQVARVWISY